MTRKTSRSARNLSKTFSDLLSSLPSASIERSTDDKNWYIKCSLKKNRLSSELGKYTLYLTSRCIGRGAYGKVYAATSEGGMDCAIKVVQSVLPREFTAPLRAGVRLEDHLVNSLPSCILNALNEISFLRTLCKHRNISTITDAAVCVHTEEPVDHETHQFVKLSVLVITELGKSRTLQYYVPPYVIFRDYEKEEANKYHFRGTLTSSTFNKLPGSSVTESGLHLSSSWWWTLHLCSNILSAVLYLHEKHSIAHRDIKPDNFIFVPSNERDLPKETILNVQLIESSTYMQQLVAHSCGPGEDHPGDSGNHWTLQLIDFGGAVRCDPNTRVHSLSGTPHYTAPEVAQKVLDTYSSNYQLETRTFGDSPFSFTGDELMAIDRWSVGVLLLELTAGIMRTGLFSERSQARSEYAYSPEDSTAEDKECNESEFQILGQHKGVLSEIASMTDETLRTRCTDLLRKK